MKTTLIILCVFLFCSCTSSGKLTDAEFPYKITYGTKLSGTEITATAPTSVGSYLIVPSFTDRAALERIQDKYDMQIYSFLIGFLLICFLILAWTFLRKDEKITLPDEFNQNY